MGIQDHLIFPLRNLYVGQEATVTVLTGTTDWFRIEKGIWQGCLLSPSLFSAIRVVSSTYLRLLMFLLPVLIPAYNSSQPVISHDVLSV